MSTFFLFILSFHFVVFKVKLILFDSVKSWDWLIQLRRTEEFMNAVRRGCTVGEKVLQLPSVTSLTHNWERWGTNRWRAESRTVEQKAKRCFLTTAGNFFQFFSHSPLQGLFYCCFFSLNFFRFSSHSIYKKNLSLKERKKNFRKHLVLTDRDIV